jgi:hypothetical protein
VAFPYSLPQDCKVVEAIAPVAGGAITGDYVSLKNAHKCWVLVHIAQAHIAPVAITIEQATDVSGAGHIPITNAVPIHANEDCAASDTLVAQTAAVGFTTSAAQKHKMVIFEIDPALFSLAGADCLTVKTAASDVTNITSAIYILAERYPSQNPPSAIID